MIFSQIIHRSKLVLFLFVFAGALSHAGTAGGSTLRLENDLLRVDYDDDARSFSLTEKSSGLMWLRQGQFDAASGSARLESCKDPVFGKGERISLDASGTGVRWLELYRGLPFLLLRGELRNDGVTPEDIRRLTPIAFDVDLGVSPNELRTMGTAGLTTPDQNPGSYLFLTLAEPATRRGMVAGWLTSDRGGGVLFSEVKDGRVRLRTQVDYGHLLLQPHGSTRLETLALGCFKDARIGEERFADALARQNGVRLRPPLAGYCTWYSNPHGGAADEKAIVELADFAARELKPFGFSFVQIDDQWQDGKQRNGPARRFTQVRPDGPYPHGMKPVADEFRRLGLRAGIWFLPFASDYQDPEFKERQNWFVKRADGKPFETPWGNTSLDLTRPEVQDYLTQMIHTIHGWGYDYFKMDGLWTGTATEQIYVNDGYRDDQMGTNAPFFNPRKTNLEAFRDGLRLLRKAAGPEVFFSGCNVSQNMRTLGGSIGLVDSMRIGPDNGQRWGDYHREIAENGSGSLVTGPVRGTRLYFLNGRVWWNDPDPTYVRATVPLSEARLITSWVALSSQIYLNSDWLPELPAERLEIIKRTIPAHGGLARPVDYFDGPMPKIWLVSDTRHGVRRDVLGLFNWDDDDQVISCTAAKAGLDEARNYYAFDFWADTPAEPFSAEFGYRVPKRACRVIAVRAREGHPVLVSTSRHVSQGILEVTEEKWNASARVLSGTSRVIGGDAYELRLAGLEGEDHTWKPASAKVSRADQRAGVTITIQPSVAEEKGWLRVKISSRETRAIEWSVQFKQGDKG